MILVSFEQFCINYANEQLHRHFIGITILAAEEDLREEGLSTYLFNPRSDTVHRPLSSTESVDWWDNSHVLSAILSSARLLDEACCLNRVHPSGCLPPFPNCSVWPCDSRSPQRCSSNSPSLPFAALDPREASWLEQLSQLSQSNRLQTPGPQAVISLIRKCAFISSK
ncbi:unnamed protein product [Protopolystoma xenopodis]|uniref:Myosin motor domain-containing protein n=1 Tax=Protopolystoma xenopodis TaxID=117903 RepID=A0A3S4ZU48_9PLAT|nr:unnamed protein product [Protopolystoma xenopodis]